MFRIMIAFMLIDFNLLAANITKATVIRAGSGGIILAQGLNKAGFKKIILKKKDCICDKCFTHVYGVGSRLSEFEILALTQ